MKRIVWICFILGFEWYFYINVISNFKWCVSEELSAELSLIGRLKKERKKERKKETKKQRNKERNKEEFKSLIIFRLRYVS